MLLENTHFYLPQLPIFFLDAGVTIPVEWWNRKTPHSSFAGPILSSPFPMQTSAANSGYLQAIKKPRKFTKQTTACELPHRNPSGISTNQNTTQTSDIKHCVGTRHHTTHLCIHSVKCFPYMQFMACVSKATMNDEGFFWLIFVSLPGILKNPDFHYLLQ